MVLKLLGCCKNFLSKIQSVTRERMRWFPVSCFPFTCAKGGNPTKLEQYRCLCKEISASSLFVSAAGSSIDLDIDLQIAVQAMAHYNGLEMSKLSKNEQRCAKI